MSIESVPRRSFLGRFVVGSVAALSATPALAASACAPAAPPSAAPSNDLDDWLATMHGPEKVFYDATMAAGASDGILFARNFLKFSQEKLGTKDSEMSVIVGFRHFATPFGYNDAMWAKYPQFAALLKVEDPKTKKPAARNVPLHDDVEGFDGASLPALTARGVKFSVCGAATSFIAGIIAGKTGDAKAIDAELGANLIPGAIMAPAGVVAVQRAQKAGFAYTYTG
jgi:intracellular sulfur oxidation DsrE/DsrF family protein